MELAIPFKLNNEEYDNIAGEFNILFRESRNSPEKLIEFCETYPDKRINIEMDILDCSLVRLLDKAHPNVHIRIKMVGQLDAIPLLQKQNSKFFIDYTIQPARSFSELHYLASLGVSDIYVADDLVYSMRKVHDYTQANNIGVRMVLNRIPSSFPDTDDPTGPWFAPQVLHVIKPYIDTVEFDCGSPFDWHQFGVYYRTWFTRKHWHGDLREIYPDLDLVIPNDSLFAEELIKYKIQCDRHCASDVIQYCHRCEQFVELAQEMAERKIGVFIKEAEGEEE